MRTEFYEYRDGQEVCEAFVATPAEDGRRPAVLVAHAWGGQGEHERETAAKLAELGYLGFALDNYGKGKRGGEKYNAADLMAPLRADRGMLLRRLTAGVTAALAHPDVDPARGVVVLGYCFGGLCALDLARSGHPAVKGAVSFHGVFEPSGLPEKPIGAKVLVCHGYDDPMAKPEQLVALANELTRNGADWQIHAYGHTLHGFTHVGANAPERGVKYNEAADRRSWQATVNFLAEIFG